VRGRIGPNFLVKVNLANENGLYDALDPRTADFKLNFFEGGEPVEIAIPAGDPGWTRSGIAYLWKGFVSGRRVSVRYRRVRSGSWEITVKGHHGNGARTPARRS
jgi:hypothetical protein